MDVVRLLLITQFLNISDKGLLSCAVCVTRFGRSVAETARSVVWPDNAVYERIDLGVSLSATLPRLCTD